MKTLDVAEAIKHMDDCLNRTYRDRESFELLKNGVPYACLVPVTGLGCDSHELADELASANLITEDKHALAAALRKGRKTLKPLKNPWA